MATTPAPGEYGVVRTKGFVAWAIRLFTRSQVNHAFIVLEDGHSIVEAQAVGAVVADLSKWDGHLIVYSRIHANPLTAAAVITAARGLLGRRYNFLDLVALALLLLGRRWDWLLERAQRSDRLICSQLVDRAFRDAGQALFDDGRPDGEVTPGDLLLLIAEDVPTHTLEAIA